ncbi:coiled-coil domain-containing protein 96 isoform X1 [Myxocyprinus asiaticus]|uniref:coiled-coil domain-containing protein 96 isoform X1 n=1 Tax=Myxocyprinus asiaticus TaxID=70543 RepID=UPI002221CED7|nr:coiled-coil domain-containing protein 96 isoform X1 [Myxocyprinus asiaticus]
MEEGSEETENNTLVENTKTSEDPTQVASAQIGEEEPESALHIISEAFENDVEEQSCPQDMSITHIGESSGPAEIESGQSMVTEEDVGPEPLIIETMEDTEGPEIEHLIEELESGEGILTAEEEEEENRSPVSNPCMPEKVRSSPPGESLVPAEKEEVGFNITFEEQMDLLHELQAEHDNLSKLNGQLQNKIAEHLSKKTADDEHPKMAKEISVQEQYQECMDLMEDLKLQHHRRSELYQQQTVELHQQSQEKLNQVKQELRLFATLKHEVALTALTGKVGKRAALAKLEQLHAEEQKQEDELAYVRLNNIKLKNKICKYEAALHSKQELADGLLLMDFEQLKTENQTFKAKYKERREELLRLKKKVACSVQGISHVKEKLNFLQMENEAKRTHLAEAEALVAHKRDVLTRTRQARDSLRTDNLKLQQRCGLLGNTTMLRDFEEKVDTSEFLQHRLEMLKRRHAELILKCAGVKQKIEQSKPEYK